MFDMRCHENGIEHRLTKNQASVDQRAGRAHEPHHQGSHQQLEAHLTDFIAADNYGRRIKTLKGLTPYEYICKIWTAEPNRFSLDPIHQVPGLST